MLEYSALDPVDERGNTVVVFQTEAGYMTAIFTNGSHVHVLIGTNEAANTHGEMYFTSRGAKFDVHGGLHLFAESGWTPVNHEGTAYSHLRTDSTPSGDLTELRQELVKAEVRSVIRHYVSAHPDVLAHAEARERAHDYRRALSAWEQAEQAAQDAQRAADEARKAADSARAAELREAVTVDQAGYGS